MNIRKNYYEYMNWVQQIIENSFRLCTVCRFTEGRPGSWLAIEGRWNREFYASAAGLCRIPMHQCTVHWKTELSHTACRLIGHNVCRSSKGKGKGLDICYSATYLSQTRDQQRFTISEVAADWHEPVVPQRIMWPSIARTNKQLDPQCS